MKKIGLLVLSAVGILSLAACNKEEVQTETKRVHFEKVDRTEKYYPEGLDVDTHAITLYDDEPDVGYQVEANILPFKAYQAKLIYTSKNPGIATVDENGVAVGVSAGETVITVSSEDKPDVKVDIPVYVVTRSDTETMTPKYTAMKALQKARFATYKDDDGDPIPNRFVETEHRDSLVYVIDDPTLPTDQQTMTFIRGYKENEIYEGDREEGYFGIKGVNLDVKVVDGNSDYTNYAWLAHNDDTYETHVYHISGSTKNVLSIPTQAYIGKERIQPVFDTFGFMFTNGKSLVSSQFSSVTSTGDLDDVSKYSSMITRTGYYEDPETHEEIISHRLEQLGYSGNDSVVDPDDESSLEVPAGTKYVSDVIIEMTWKNGVVVAMDYDYRMTYVDERDPYYYNEDGSIRVDEYGEIIDKKYVRVTKLNMRFEADEDAEITLPTPKGFNPVAEIWDL